MSSSDAIKFFFASCRSSSCRGSERLIVTVFFLYMWLFNLNK